MDGTGSVRKAVFPAAGLGTRFLPATKAQPKEMLVLVDKPIIQYGVEEAVQSGVSNIVIVTGRGKNAIEDHFDVAMELESFLRAARQDGAAGRDPQDHRADQGRVRAAGRAARPRPRGAGHQSARRRRAVRRHPRRRRHRRHAAGAAADDRRLRAGERTRSSLVERVPREDVSSYGIVAIDESVDLGPGVYRVKDLVEKPRLDEAPSNLAIIGRYILTPDIFPALEAVAARSQRRDPAHQRPAAAAPAAADLRL